MLGYGVASVAFAGLAIFIVIRRENGILKRIRATPLPAWAYIAAVIGATLAAYALNTAAVLALGKALVRRPAPRALALARADAAARRARVRGDGPRPHGRDPLGARGRRRP